MSTPPDDTSAAPPAADLPESPGKSNSPSSPDPKGQAAPPLRRQLLIAGATALTVGAGVAVWRRQAASASKLPEIDAFRRLQPPRPDGTPLDLSALAGRPLLINFWATWCAPCVRELPRLDAWAQQQAEQAAAGAAGWTVLGLAIDQPAAVSAFLARQPVKFPVAVLGFEGLRWVRLWGNASGVLPFTVAISADDRLLHSKLGEVQPEDLMRWKAV